MRRQSFLHRVTALLSGALLLQLLLLGAGRPCHMHGAHGVAASAGEAIASAAAHAGHGGSAAQPRLVAGAHSASTMSTSACDATISSSSCGAPWSPTGCASMSACAGMVTMTGAAYAASATPTTTGIRIAAALSVPLGPALAPELPPPRA